MRLIADFTESITGKKISAEIENNMVYVVRHLEKIPDNDQSFLTDTGGRRYVRFIDNIYIGGPISVYRGL